MALIQDTFALVILSPYDNSSYGPQMEESDTWFHQNKYGLSTLGIVISTNPKAGIWEQNTNHILSQYMNPATRIGRPIKNAKS